MIDDDVSVGIAAAAVAGRLGADVNDDEDGPRDR